VDRAVPREVRAGELFALAEVAPGHRNREEPAAVQDLMATAGRGGDRQPRVALDGPSALKATEQPDNRMGPCAQTVTPGEVTHVSGNKVPIARWSFIVTRCGHYLLSLTGK
jgi:hypothetical protein